MISGSETSSPSAFPLGGAVAFYGSRHGSPFPVSLVVAAVLSAGGSVRVGCAPGVDAAVRSSYEGMLVNHARRERRSKWLGNWPALLPSSQSQDHVSAVREATGSPPWERGFVPSCIRRPFCGSFVSESIRRCHPIKELAQPSLVDRKHELEAVLLRCGVLQRSCVDRLVACISVQLLDDLPRLLVAATQIAWRRARFANPLVERCEVDVERLRRRTVSPGIHEFGVGSRNRWDEQRRTPVYELISPARRSAEVRSGESRRI
jgi:hypothetical protein